MFYLDEETAKFCKIIKIGDVKVPKGCLFFGQGNVRHTGGGWEWYYGLRYYPYLIAESVDSNIAVAVSYGDPLLRNMQ